MALQVRVGGLDDGLADASGFGVEPQPVVDGALRRLDPAHRPWELDRVAAQRIGRGGHTRGLLGVGHHRFEGIKLTGKASGQTVRQQAEGGGWLSRQYQRAICVPRGVLRA